MVEIYLINCYASFIASKGRKELFDNIQICNIINGHLRWLIENNKSTIADKIELPLSKITNNLLDPFSIFIKENFNREETLKILSRIVEQQSNRKKRGVFYTPKDVTEYIAMNSVYRFVTKDVKHVFPTEIAYKRILMEKKESLLDFCITKTIFDPTCGAGEFTLSLLRIKLNILDKLGALTEDNIIRVLKTIYANDISVNALIVAKCRTIVMLEDYLSSEGFKKILKVLEKNYLNYDFFDTPTFKIPKIDLIIGNPPYIEYSKLEIKPTLRMGNTYANVMINSLLYLSDKGMIAYIIPISFMATTRMKILRKKIIDTFNNVTILSFADRPDCLFVGVHQKLNIVFASSFGEKELYTSDYIYWYKEERRKLFEKVNVITNEDMANNYVPKYGTQVAKNFFEIVNDHNNGDSLLQLMTKKGDNTPIYLNSRISFFVKAFIKSQTSSEYKKFFVKKYSPLMMISILNSSTFWVYWVQISDGWHITNKDLSNFILPRIDLKHQKRLETLAKKLLVRLEETKKYVGTVQTEYEYKHKLAFDIIDEIDDELADIYGFNESETKFIKQFARKYREGNINAKSN